MRIILFRHGEHENDNLTDFGKKQVELIGKQLELFNITKIYSSPANRCLQTAKILSQLINNKKICVKQGLNERFQLHHTPTNQDEQKWWDNYMNSNFCPKNNKVGETCNEYLLRNYKVFEEIAKNTPSNEDALVVAHSSTSYALTSFIWKTNDLQWMKIGNSNFLVFEIL